LPGDAAYKMAEIVLDMLFYLFSLVQSLGNHEVLGAWGGSGTWLWCLDLSVV